MFSSFRLWIYKKIIYRKVNRLLHGIENRYALRNVILSYEDGVSSIKRVSIVKKDDTLIYYYNNNSVGRVKCEYDKDNLLYIINNVVKVIPIDIKVKRVLKINYKDV